jgi:hypothetical protein
LGEQLNCEILANGLKHTKKLVDEATNKTVYKAGYLQKAKYYAEKYPSKH